MSPNGGPNIEAWLADRRTEIDALLERRLPVPDTDPGRLIEAIRYSLLAPGKRLRPALGLAAASAVGATATEAIRIATAAVELIHCYSLIHDDLPAMDDDDVRRGRPSNHKVFGEATAILAGDALTAMAFEWIAEAGALAGPAFAAAYLEAARVLAHAAGPTGMVRGQARDLHQPDQAGAPTLASIEALEALHAEKTAALFQAAIEVGAIVGGGNPAQRTALARFGRCFGIAFQHADDLSDEEHQHLAPQARQRLRELTAEALQALGDGEFGSKATHLAGLANHLQSRGG